MRVVEYLDAIRGRSVSEIWAACLARRAEPLDGSALRLVESQEQIATIALVGSLAEQAVLETCSRPKPPLRSRRAGLHYLLATPFRYPPLN